MAQCRRRKGTARDAPLPRGVQRAPVHRAAGPLPTAPELLPLGARRVGDSEAQQAQLSAVTKEATAKALLITIKKLQARAALFGCLQCLVWFHGGGQLGRRHSLPAARGAAAQRRSVGAARETMGRASWPACLARPPPRRA